MNQTFLNYAIKLLNNMSPADLKAKLEEHGFEVKSVHAGKKLSDVPYEEVYIGMEVISMKGNPGKVFNKIDKQIQHDDNWLTVKWDHGVISSNEHYTFDLVRVK